MSGYGYRTAVFCECYRVVDDYDLSRPLRVRLFDSSVRLAIDREDNNSLNGREFDCGGAYSDAFRYRGDNSTVE